MVKKQGKNYGGYFITLLFLILFSLSLGCSEEGTISGNGNDSIYVQNRDINIEKLDELSIKDVLNPDDYHVIFALHRTERKKILENRGWKEWIITENSYFEMFKNDTTLAVKGQNIPQALKDSIIRECSEKERYLPFENLKYQEKWIPSEKDTKTYFQYCEKLRRGRDSQNNCNFNLRTPGDIIVCHGGDAIPVLGHAGIVVKSGTPSQSDVVSSYSKGGVKYDNIIKYNTHYDRAALLGIHTWPYNGPTTRAKAVSYARSKVGKPYGCWLNKWDQSRFYCSSIAWAAYYWPSHWYARIDLDDERTPQWVAPDELLASPRTYVKSVSW